MKLENVKVQTFVDYQNGEEWRDVVGREGFYEVSNKGKVRRYKGKELAIVPNKSGYVRVLFSCNGKRT